MAITQAWNGRGMGVDAYSADVNAVNVPVICRRFIDGRLWFLIKKKTLHSWRHITRPLRSISSDLHSDIAFSWKFVLFPIHIIVVRGYICTSCMFWTYLYSFIRLYYKFTYLKTPWLTQQLELASFSSAFRCTIHYTKWPGSSLWYFLLYTSIFINFEFKLIIKYFSVIQFEISMN